MDETTISLHVRIDRIDNGFLLQGMKTNGWIENETNLRYFEILRDVQAAVPEFIDHLNELPLEPPQV